MGFNVTIEKVNSAKFYGLVTEGKHALYIGDMGFNVPEPQEQFLGQLAARSPPPALGLLRQEMGRAAGAASGRKGPGQRLEMVFTLQKMLLCRHHVANYYNRFSTVASNGSRGTFRCRSVTCTSTRFT